METSNNGEVTSARRLAFTLATPAIAWVVHEIGSALVTFQTCATGHPALGRALLSVLTVTMLVVAGFATMAGFRSFRAFHAGRLELAADAPTPDELMSLGSVLLGVLFLVAIVWSGLPGLVLASLCGAQR